MNSGRGTKTGAISGLAVSLAMLAVLAQAADPTPTPQGQSLARIIAITGHVTLGIPGDDSRHASRGEDLQPGQTLRTHNASSVQIRLDDDSLLILEENTSLQALAISVQQDGNTTVHLRLSQGAVRVIGDQRGFLIDTPLATVRGRASNAGSTYDCALGEMLDCGVYDGAITVENARGMVWLGGDSDFSFAHVSAVDSAPDAVLEKPEPLKNPNAPPPRPRLQPAAPPMARDNTFPHVEPEPIRIVPSRN